MLVPRFGLVIVPLVVVFAVLTSCSTAPEEGGPLTVRSQPTLSVTPSPPAEPGRASVVRAVDGDTLAVLLEPDGATARVRPLGVDAPERGDCGYREATNYVNGQVPVGAVVTLVIDRTDGDRDDVDRYGRLLRYVRYTPPGDDVERDLSLMVVLAGWGESYDQYPVRLTPDLERAEVSARGEQAGVWGLCG